GVATFRPLRAVSATGKLATIVDFIEFCTACHAEGRGFRAPSLPPFVSRPRASARSRASACDSRGDQRPASTSTARPFFGWMDDFASRILRPCSLCVSEYKTAGLGPQDSPSLSFHCHRRLARAAPSFCHLSPKIVPDPAKPPESAKPPP